MNPGSQGGLTLLPYITSFLCFLPSRRCSTQVAVGCRCSPRGGHNQLCYGKAGVGGERRRLGGLEDFPKEASPGQMGEEGSAPRQERASFKQDSCFLETRASPFDLSLHSGLI